MYDIAIIFKRNLLHGKVFTNYSTSARKNNHHPSPIIKMLTKPADLCQSGFQNQKTLEA